jgi:hypothetical protein
MAGHVKAEEVLDSVRRRAYVDQDPVFTQLWEAEYGAELGFDRHDAFFSVGLDIGTPLTDIPDCGRRWHHLLPPVVLDLWPPRSDPPCARFTTVASWGSFRDVSHRGVWYGSKHRELERFAALPRRAGQELAVALRRYDPRDPAIELLRSNGWAIVDTSEVAGVDSYRDFIGRSRAEIGIAKHAYAAARSGWFSDRSAHYLGRVEPGARPVAERRLGGRVRRLTLSGGRRASLIVKRVDRVAARKTALLGRRWLPAAGLQDHGPPLLASAPAGGGSVWQLFEDLGDCALSPDRPGRSGLEAASRLVARLHLAFAGHSLLPGWVEEFGGLDERLYAEWVRQASRALEAIRAAGLPRDRLALRDRLRRRLDALREEEPGRARRLRELGWPVTLLHGDLWPQNVLLPPPRDGRRARLIDWDRSGVGPVAYDLSTFVARLSPPLRTPALRLYARAVGAAGWRLPGPAELNDAFETTERARLASCLISPAAAAAEGAGWAFGELATVDAWFAALRPVLPVEGR